MNPLATALLMAFFGGWFCWQLYGRFGALARMAPENRLDRPLARLARMAKVGLAQVKLIGPKRERRSGLMHALIFWGALVVGLRELIVMGEGFVEGFQHHLPLLGPDHWLGFAYITTYNVAEAVVAAMILYALARRLASRPKRLDLNWEGIYVLLFILAIVASDLLFDGAKLALISQGAELAQLSSPVYGTEADWAPVAAWLAGGLAGLDGRLLFGLYQTAFWGHLLVMLTFLNVLPNTKQFHEITALPNVFFSSLDRPHAPITLLALEDEKAWEEERLGVARLEQLTWKMGLDFLSCTECGRCYDICPTYLTGKPLTQKWVNQSLLHYFRDEQKNLLKTGKAGPDKSLVGDVISTDTLWACTTCRACEEACPVNIEHVPRMIAMRQGQTLMAEAYPKELANTFKGLERNGNPWGIGYDQRANWAKDQGVKIIGQTDEAVELVFWVGCMGSFDPRGQKIAQATAQLLKQAGVKFAILGNQEKCSGDLARRTGNEMLYQMLAGENIERLNTLGVKTLITICPHCLNTLANEYPQLNGRYQVFHHSQYLEKLAAEGRLNTRPTLEGGYTFHDPCYLGRYNHEYQAPRALAARAAQGPALEMEKQGPQSVCCGAGGGRMWMEENIGSRINEERFRQATATGAKTIVTACPFCMTMLEDAAKAAGQEEAVRVMDVAELALKGSQPVKS